MQNRNGPDAKTVLMFRAALYALIRAYHFIEVMSEKRF